MSRDYIDKLAYILIRDRKVLTSLSKGKSVWYIPGGKREKGESDAEALIREVSEELSVSLKAATIQYYGTFEAQAHGKPDGIIVRMTCYEAEFDGELAPDNEIEAIKFVDYSWRDKSAPVDRLIFDDLKQNDLIN